MAGTATKEVNLSAYRRLWQKRLRPAAGTRNRHAMAAALQKAIAVARRIGKVEVDHGDTDCRTPDAEQYILKCVARESKGKKARTRC